MRELRLREKTAELDMIYYSFSQATKEKTENQVLHSQNRASLFAHCVSPLRACLLTPTPTSDKPDKYSGLPSEGELYWKPTGLQRKHTWKTPYWRDTNSMEKKTKNLQNRGVNRKDIVQQTKENEKL